MVRIERKILKPNVRISKETTDATAEDQYCNIVSQYIFWIPNPVIGIPIYWPNVYTVSAWEDSVGGQATKSKRGKDNKTYPAKNKLETGEDKAGIWVNAAWYGNEAAKIIDLTSIIFIAAMIDIAAIFIWLKLDQFEVQVKVRSRLRSILFMDQWIANDKLSDNLGSPWIKTNQVQLAVAASTYAETAAEAEIPMAVKEVPAIEIPAEKIKYKTPTESKGTSGILTIPLVIIKIITSGMVNPYSSVQEHIRTPANISGVGRDKSTEIPTRKIVAASAAPVMITKATKINPVENSQTGTSKSSDKIPAPIKNK